MGNATQRQAQTTLRPRWATGHRRPGASTEHQTLPGHTGSSPSHKTRCPHRPPHKRWCSHRAQASPDGPITSARPREGPRETPGRAEAAVPLERLQPEPSSGPRECSPWPRPAEVNAGNSLGIPRELRRARQRSARPGSQRRGAQGSSRPGLGRQHRGQPQWAGGQEVGPRGQGARQAGRTHTTGASSQPGTQGPPGLTAA